MQNSDLIDDPDSQMSQSIMSPSNDLPSSDLNHDTDSQPSRALQLQPLPTITTGKRYLTEILPIEIRNQIWEELLVDKEYGLRIIQPFVPPTNPLRLSVLRVNKQCSQEAGQILYGGQIIVFRQPKTMIDGLGHIGPTNVSYIREVWIESPLLQKGFLRRNIRVALRLLIVAKGLKRIWISHSDVCGLTKDNFNPYLRMLPKAAVSSSDYAIANIVNCFIKFLAKLRNNKHRYDVVDLLRITTGVPYDGTDDIPDHGPSMQECETNPVWRSCKNDYTYYEFADTLRLPFCDCVYKGKCNSAKQAELKRAISKALSLTKDKSINQEVARIN